MLFVASNSKWELLIWKIRLKINFQVYIKKTN